MPTLLALDASSTACSCALIRNRQIVQRFEIAPREHTRLLLPMIDEVLAEAGVTLTQLDAVAYGHGPGSFTGLRIAAGIAQGLAYGADLPLIGVSTLEALALAAHRKWHARHVIAALDARMDEIYVGAYHCHDGALTVALDPRVVPPSRLRLPATDRDIEWLGIGSGWQLLSNIPVDVQAALPQTLPDELPAAEDLVRLAATSWERGARGSAPHEVIPVYLRDEVAWRKA
ncbi:MAG: tRNA (adenosine(37)-N6)-threonylcarbamoyltransferase complex dimerization subunit type 1 TsaB [Salinicola sp.]|uniref:tRNA (adenosine(37)-N6)-threonylcarbamoyltransferase complex dimerization subunit type 1 TsaB n=1 Tax=uncultured Salinicola sp. TaxID=1193542 RepID=UPI000C9467EB|nr:tRNA (adenosine(37)-N6)-threonylcarbamoyltransferase complex dimerization subunit type 1 TsaB [uncultured Salinicola sp.]MAM57574.1 tRNA (adenosine(37)-N6)-threonylcarbamoyltransferase complex dimerization subunit type 1 TsaB [Salinicola sp.]